MCIRRYTGFLYFVILMLTSQKKITQMSLCERQKNKFKNTKMMIIISVLCHIIFVVELKK